jgi:hypothetical protein
VYYLFRNYASEGMPQRRGRRYVRAADLKEY